VGLLDRFRPPRAPSVPVVGTRLGIDGGFCAVVDGSAVVHLLDRPLRVGWWIGADDRWYDPSAERAVRQTRPGPAPVLETRLRVAGGDIVATTWAAIGDGPAVVVELANETPVPVAVAITVDGDVRGIAVDGRRLLADGGVACAVDRDAGRFALVDGSTDLWSVVTGGGAVEAVPGPVSSRDGKAAGALIVPLLHRQSLRFVVPGGDASLFPGPDRVASGWATRLEQAARVEIPDESLNASVPTGLVDLLLAEPTPDVAVQLAAWGLLRDAVDRIAAHHQDDPAGWLRAAATCWGLHRRPGAFVDLPLEALVNSGIASASEPGAVARLAGLFAARGDARAAADAATLTGPVADPQGSLWDLTRRLAAPLGDGLALLGEVPASWYGQPVDVHGLPTVHGTLSYGIRWHGERPALLWELERHDDHPVRLTVPGLDPDFSTTEPTGEALLASPPRATAAPPPESGSFS